MVWNVSLLSVTTNSTCNCNFDDDDVNNDLDPEGLRWSSNFPKNNTEMLLWSAATAAGAYLVLKLIQSFFHWKDPPVEEPPPPTKPKKSEEQSILECPLVTASWSSYLMFSWCAPLLKRSRTSETDPLTDRDLWELLPSIKASTVFDIFNSKKSTKEPKKGSIFTNILLPLWKVSGCTYILAIACWCARSTVAMLAPKVMGYLIDFVEDTSESKSVHEGYFWALMLFLIYFLQAFFQEQYFYQIFTCNVNVGSCVSMKIYEKALRLSSSARKGKTTGEIVNLMSVDTEKLRRLLYELDALFSTPMLVGLGVVFIWAELGIAILPGLLVIMALIPINWVLMSTSSKYEEYQTAKKDERVKILSELLGGIQAIKMYSWESSFKSQIDKVRKEEMEVLKKQSNLGSMTEFIFDSIPFLVSVTSFYTYVYFSGGELDAKKAFMSMAIFELLTHPIQELPCCIDSLVESANSFRRLNDFLNAEEIDPEAVTKIESRSGSDFSIRIRNGTFSWEEELEVESGFSSSCFRLSNINLSIPTGKLTAIVGQVASGKSSLFSAILGDMKKHSGRVEVCGRIAYAPQIPWILNATLRDNICFGRAYEPEVYDEVVKACCLAPDIKMLPGGDLTEIGEKGINLSGGQKQRVSLARAAYSGADVLLLDDVLSAVDSHVGRKIFDNLIGPKGFLAGKTRVMCTHGYTFLPKMDQVVVIKSGKIIETGSYSDITSIELNENNNEEEKSIPVCQPEVESKMNVDEDGENFEEDGKLIEEERLETGKVKPSIYLAYVKAMGIPLVSKFVFFLGLSEFLSLARTVVLSKWAEPSADSADKHLYSFGYGLIGIVQSGFYLIGTFLVSAAALQASNHLHNKMLQRILRAPMSFFNVTPLGRIVNRFSSDMDSIDTSLPDRIGDWVVHLFKLLGVIVALTFANFNFLFVFVPLLGVYYWFQRDFIQAMVQLQRMLNSRKSPMYAQFQETLAMNGTNTVRAYQAEDRFLAMFGDKIDDYNKAFYPSQIVRRWLGARLGILGALIMSFNALFAVMWSRTVNPGLVGLSLSYATNLLNILKYIIHDSAYLQNNLVAAERVLEYGEEVPQEMVKEELEGTSTPAPDSQWPQKGEISFEDYETSYRPGLPPVLKNFSCKIKPGEKIGIVGRTGAGKSSLVLSLFRIIERNSGKIKIDGVDIAQVALSELREKLSVIPQDPILFSRSLRDNLDPFGRHSDKELWEALKLAHLDQFFVEGKDGSSGLSFEISEGGENLSVGQRQLVCLARAILRKSKVLVLDEATASVDKETDQLIQKTIREYFGGSCTILNVAHRLNTVLDSDRILVMSQGEMAEFDSPQVLLSDPNSHFYGMAKDAGIV